MSLALSVKDGAHQNVYGVKAHLKNHHPDHYEQFVKNKKKEQAAAKLQHFLQSFKKAKRYNYDHVNAEGITQNLMECIALDNQLFSFVEDVEMLTGFC